MEACENCGKENCLRAEFAAQVPREAECHADVEDRADCERRAKERALAEADRLSGEVARLTAELAEAPKRPTLRQTGRTTRLLLAARKLALAGRAVYVFAADDRQARALELQYREAFGNDATKFETPLTASNFDWRTLTLRGAWPNCAVLVDHHAIEVEIGQHFSKALHMWAHFSVNPDCVDSWLHGIAAAELACGGEASPKERWPPCPNCGRTERRGDVADNDQSDYCEAAIGAKSAVAGWLAADCAAAAAKAAAEEACGGEGKDGDV